MILQDWSLYGVEFVLLVCFMFLVATPYACTYSTILRLGC